MRISKRFNDYISDPKKKEVFNLFLSALVIIAGALIIVFISKNFCDVKTSEQTSEAGNMNIASSSIPSSSLSESSSQSNTSSTSVSEAENKNTSSQTDISVTSVDFNVTKKKCSIGETFTLTAKITPSNATDKSLTWITTNLDVATVSDTGVVTAKGYGTAYIRALSKSGQRDTCLVTVKKNTETKNS